MFADRKPSYPGFPYELEEAPEEQPGPHRHREARPRIFFRVSSTKKNRRGRRVSFPSREAREAPGGGRTRSDAAPGAAATSPVTDIMDFPLQGMDRRLRLIILTLFAFEAAFAAIHVACTMIRSPGVHPFFDLDQECNIPTWFSSMQLFSIGALLGFFGPKALGRVGIRRPLVYTAALIFLFLSIDEAVQVHERLNRALQSVAWMPRVGGDRGLWIFLYVGAGITLLAPMLRPTLKIWHHAPGASALAAIGAGAVLFGAVGMELVADLFLRGVDERGSIQLRHDAPYLYALEVVIEETLEMAGATLILLATCLLVLPRPLDREHLYPVQETRRGSLTPR